jgi:predicted NBD/HSP70 family sugar kinase
MPTDGEVAGQAGVLAFDLGATNLRCGIVDERGRVLIRESIRTPAGPAMTTTMVDLACRMIGTTEVTCAVVGVPGRVDYANGTLEWGRGQPPEWREVLTEATLRFPDAARGPGLRARS